MAVYTDPKHVISYEPLQLKDNLTYVEEPIQILERRDRVPHNQVIPFVKVLWKHHKTVDGTWEPELEVQKKYPHLFTPGTWEISRMKFFLGGKNVRTRPVYTLTIILEAQQIERLKFKQL